MPGRHRSVGARRRGAALALVVVAVASLGAACSKESGSQEAFCAQVRDVPALEAVLARFSEADPDVLQDRIDRARDAYRALVDAAPSEIHDETAQVVSLVDAILDAVEENPSDPAKASAQLRRAMRDHEDVAADRAKVTAYAAKRCGVQLDATLTGDGSGAPSSSTSTTEAATSSTTGG